MGSLVGRGEEDGNAKAQRHKDTKTQRHKDAKTQRRKDAKTQGRKKGTKEGQKKNRRKEQNTKAEVGSIRRPADAATAGEASGKMGRFAP
jgi:hypothetical protein